MLSNELRNTDILDIEISMDNQFGSLLNILWDAERVTRIPYNFIRVKLYYREHDTWTNAFSFLVQEINKINGIFSSMLSAQFAQATLLMIF